MMTHASPTEGLATPRRQRPPHRWVGAPTTTHAPPPRVRNATTTPAHCQLGGRLQRRDGKPHENKDETTAELGRPRRPQRRETPNEGKWIRAEPGGSAPFFFSFLLLCFFYLG